MDTWHANKIGKDLLFLKILLNFAQENSFKYFCKYIIGYAKYRGTPLFLHTSNQLGDRPIYLSLPSFGILKH